MLSRILQDDKNLILWNNRYYVVNNFTKTLLECFDKKLSLDEIAKETSCSKRQLKKFYNEIEKKLLDVEYYEDNLELETPIKIQWKITKKCNLKCKHCYLGSLNNVAPSKELVDKILKEIINSNVMEVTISGGECLTYEYIDYVIKRLIASKIKVTLFTNGLLLKQFLDKLNEDLTSYLNIYVSVDGLQKTHELIRGENTYKRTINNIEYAIKLGYEITTSTVVNSINYDEIIGMVQKLKEIGVKNVQLANVIIKGNADKKLLITHDMQLKLKEDIFNLYKEHPEYGYIFYTDVPDEEGHKKVFKIQNGKYDFYGIDNWRCTAGLARATIDESGKMYCCPFIEKSFIGDLNTNSLKEIWQNKNRYKFLQMLLEKNVGKVCFVMKNEEI